MIGADRFPPLPAGNTTVVDRMSRRLAQVTWVTGCLSLSVALQLVHNISGW